MGQLRIDEVMKSSTGKSWRVKSGNQWYGADLDSGVDSMKGAVISAEVKTSKAGPWLTGIGIPPASRIEPVSLQIAPRAPQTLTQGSAPWWMPFASNTVAHAIQSGYIKEPSDIKVWVLAAKQAAESADSDVPM